MQHGVVGDLLSGYFLIFQCQEQEEKVVIRMLVHSIHPEGGGVHPYIHYIGMCRAIGYGF